MDDKIKITNTAILAPMAAAVFVAGLLCGIAIAPENEPWTLPDGRAVSYDAGTGCIRGCGNGGSSTLCGGQSGGDAVVSVETLRAGGGGGAGAPASSSAAREGGGSSYCNSTGPHSAVCTYRLEIK